MFERVCLSVYVCMPQTYIHQPNIHTQLVDLPYRKAFQKALGRVCMFKNPLSVMDFKHTYMLRAQHDTCAWTPNKVFRKRVVWDRCAQTQTQCRPPGLQLVHTKYGSG